MASFNSLAVPPALTAIDVSAAVGEATHLIGPASASAAIVVWDLLNGRGLSEALLNGVLYFGIDAAADVAMTDGVGYDNNRAPGADLHLTEVLHQPVLVSLVYAQIKLLRQRKDNSLDYALRFFPEDVIVGYLATILGNVIKRRTPGGSVPQG